MKKPLLFLIVFSMMTSAQAQERQSTNVDSMLVNIDKSGFTSGILYDRVFPLGRA